MSVSPPHLLVERHPHRQILHALFDRLARVLVKGDCTRRCAHGLCLRSACEGVLPEWGRCDRRASHRFNCDIRPKSKGFWVMYLLVKNRIICLQKCKVCRGNVCICLDGKIRLGHRDDVQKGGTKTGQEFPQLRKRNRAYLRFFNFGTGMVLFNLIETGGVSCKPTKHIKC
jgi:hypothetical protein